jgi:hypothetical protein
LLHANPSGQPISGSHAMAHVAMFGSEHAASASSIHGRTAS